MNNEQCVDKEIYSDTEESEAPCPEKDQNQKETISDTEESKAIEEADEKEKKSTQNKIELENAKAENERIKTELEKERQRRILSENRLYCVKLLEENALPTNLCEYLTAQSEEETKKRVDDFSFIVRNAVNDEISKRLVTVSAPKQSKNTMSRGEFSRLTLAERQEIYNTDRVLYNELTK